METVTEQPIKKMIFFDASRVSPGAHSLTKKPEDSGYEIGLVEISTIETLRNDDGMASRRGSRQKVTRSTNSVRRLSSCVTQRWILGRRLVLARNANHSFRRENVEFIGDEARVDLSCVYI